MQRFNRNFLAKLLKLFFTATFVNITVQHCFELKILSYRTTETPDYGFVMTMHDNQTLSSVTILRKPVPVPMWRFLLVQHAFERRTTKSDPPKILYNSTYKVCEFWRYVKRIRVFSNIAEMLLLKDNGNMSLTCPMAAGTYVMRNIRVPPDTGILKFMYWPNTLYTLYGTVYSLLPNKSLENKCHYEINATVLKSC